MAKLQQIIVGASQKHIGSTLKDVRLDWNFLFLGKKGCQGTLKALDMMSKDIRGTKKYVGDVGSIMIENIVYIF